MTLRATFPLYGQDGLYGQSPRKAKLDKWLNQEGNREYLDIVRATELVALDKRYEEQFKEIMDDINLVRHSKTYEYPRLSELDLTIQEEREAYPELEIDHKIALVNGGKMWDEQNLWVICENCHLKKTRDDFKVKKRIELVGNGSLEEKDVKL